MERERIERVLARRPTLRYPLGADFAARLQGQTVRAVSRRAKYLVVELSSGDTLVMHLGMSGWFRVARRRAPPPSSASRSNGGRYNDRTLLDAHDHVVFEMSSGAAVIFNDPRRFGFMKVLSAEALAADPALSILGPEPLDRTFTAEVLASRLRGKKRATLKAALLDQRVVAGLGNIYVSEALHRASLLPTRRAATLVTRGGLPTARAYALVDAIKATLRDAIANRHRSGGSDRFLVYDHAGRRCPRRGCPGTIKRRVQLGRSTFFCPVCQR